MSSTTSVGGKRKSSALSDSPYDVPQRILEIASDIEIPVLTSIAKVYLIFYKTCSSLGNSSGELQVLQDEVTDGVKMPRNRTKSIEYLCRSMNEEEKEIFQRPFDQFRELVDESTNFMAQRQHLFLTDNNRNHDEAQTLLGAASKVICTIGSTLYRSIVAPQDKQKLSELISRLQSARQAIQITICEASHLRSLQVQSQSDMELIRELLKIREFKHTDWFSYQPGTREWMHTVVSQWLFMEKDGDRTIATRRLFWISGNAGVGKSAFASSLATRWKDSLLGAIFYQFNDQSFNAKELMKSLAYQIATNVESVRSSIIEAVKSLFPSNVKHDYTVLELFTELILKPLNKSYSGAESASMLPMLIIMDALDECGDRYSVERREMLEVLRLYIHKLPQWVKILVTSRREEDISEKLSIFEPVEIREDDPRHINDLQVYAYELLRKHWVAEETISQAAALLLRRSEGKFVYLKTIDEQYPGSSTWTLEMLEIELPQGIDKSYRRYMEQLSRVQYLHKGRIDALIRYRTTLLELIVANYEPMAVDLGRQIMKKHHENEHFEDETYDFIIEQLKVLFPIHIQNGQQRFFPFHKSLVDWLINRNRSDEYFINPKAGHRLLSDWYQTHRKFHDVRVISEHRVVSGSYEKKLYVTDIRNGKCLKVLAGHNDHVTVICILPDGRIVSGSYDETLRVWDAESGHCIKSLRGHSAAVGAICALPNSRLVSGSWRGEIFVWNVESSTFVSLKRHSKAISVLCALSNSNMVSASRDRSICVWNLKSNQCTMTLEGHSAFVTAMHELTRNRIVTGSYDSTLRVWDLLNGQCLVTMAKHMDYVITVCTLPSDGHIISGSNDETLCVWHSESGELIKRIECPGVVMSSLCTLPTKNLLISADRSEQLHVWDLKNGCRVQIISKVDYPCEDLKDD